MSVQRISDSSPSSFPIKTVRIALPRFSRKFEMLSGFVISVKPQRTRTTYGIAPFPILDFDRNIKMAREAGIEDEVFVVNKARNYQMQFDFQRIADERHRHRGEVDHDIANAA